MNLNDCSRNLCVPVAPWLRGHMFSRSERHPSGTPADFWIYAPENIYFETKRFDPKRSLDAFTRLGYRPMPGAMKVAVRTESCSLTEITPGAASSITSILVANRAAHRAGRRRDRRKSTWNRAILGTFHRRYHCLGGNARAKDRGRNRRERHQLAKNSAMSLSKSIRALVLLATLFTVAVALAAFQMHDPRKPDPSGGI